MVKEARWGFKKCAPKIKEWSIFHTENLVSNYCITNSKPSYCTQCACLTLQRHFNTTQVK